MTDRLFGWPGDLGPKADSVPLRLCGAFHALRLSRRGGLEPVYPPHRVDDDTLWGALDGALRGEAEFIDAWLDSPPQTNEVRRSGPLIAVGHWLAARFDLPIVTSEIGASGGLNLRWDRYALEAAGQRFGAPDPALVLRPDWTGPLPPKTQPMVTERRGVDLNPLDPSDPADALRLTAYLWPDQPERLALTQAAIAAAGDRVECADAVDWLETREMRRPGHLHLIYSTVAWQYLPVLAQARGTALIEAAGAQASKDAPLAWFGMENDGGSNGAALTLRLWPGDVSLKMGRADFHGRWINWTAT